MAHNPLPTFRLAEGTRIAQALPPQKGAVTLDSAALSRATVGQVVATLLKFGQSNLLVA